MLGALASSGLAPQRLELEITEAVLMQNSEVTLRTLHQLRALGIRISMDDFGTGYSSLSYLRSFPFDKIKIDRCFIKGLGDSSESDAIVHAVAGLADSLGMTTTAEGVETREQLDLVRIWAAPTCRASTTVPPVPVRELAKCIGAADPERRSRQPDRRPISRGPATVRARRIGARPAKRLIIAIAGNISLLKAVDCIVPVRGRMRPSDAFELPKWNFGL